MQIVLGLLVLLLVIGLGLVTLLLLAIGLGLVVLLLLVTGPTVERSLGDILVQCSKNVLPGGAI